MTCLERRSNAALFLHLSIIRKRAVNGRPYGSDSFKNCLCKTTVIIAGAPIGRPPSLFLTVVFR